MLARMTYMPPQGPQPPGVARYGTGVPVPPPPPKKGMSTGAIVFLTLFGTFCIIPMIIGAVVTIFDNDKTTGNTTSNARPPAPAAVVTTEPPPPATSGPPPAPPGPATTFGTGTYEVGVDIKAGTYTCTADQGRSGYWERNKDASGEFDAIIANDNIESGAKGIVTIKAKEFFQVNRLTCTIR